jgi:uncharacterized protein YkwD
MLNSAKPLLVNFLALSLLSALGGTLFAEYPQVFARSPRTNQSQRYAARSQNMSGLRKIALNLANRDRTKNGLSLLIPDPLLDKAAQNHVQDMLNRNYFSHYSPEGSTPTDRFSAVGGKVSAGENLAILQHPPTNLAKLNQTLLTFFEKHWMGSPEHRLNLLNPQATRFGFGIVTSGDRIYTAQLFSTQK